MGPAAILHQGQDCWIEVLNDSEKAVTIESGSLMTTASEVLEVMPARGEPAIRQTVAVGSQEVDPGGIAWTLTETVSSIPSHLQQLYRDSIGLLNTLEQTEVTSQRHPRRAK